jgi:acetyltransferase-like isoleucine patch superfamily enzyme
MDETEYTKLKERLRHDFAREPLIWGDASRVITGESVVLNNAVINVASGTVTIEDFAFLGHNVSLLTGTHDYNQLNRDRQTSVPLTGRNIVIGKGAWIASNVTILGPCTIGAHSVVCGASLVLEDVPEFTIVAGNPAKPIRSLSFLKERSTK